MPANPNMALSMRRFGSILTFSCLLISHAALSGEAELKAGVYSDIADHEGCALLQANGGKVAQHKANHALHVKDGQQQQLQLISKSSIPGSKSVKNEADKWIAITSVAMLLLVIAVKFLPKAEDSKTSLSHGFLIYFADNVLVMFMATTAGTLGMALFQSYDLNNWTTQILGLGFNGVLAIIMYAFAANRYRAGEKAEGAAEADGVLSATLHDITSKTSYEHMMQILPWMVIVPLVNLPITISGNIHETYREDPHYGHKFILHLITFFGFLCLCILSALYYTSLSDSGAKCESMYTFLVNCVNHGLLSCAGKTLHLTEDIVLKALVGPNNQSKFDRTLADVSILTWLTWFLLAHCWPKLEATTQFDKLRKNILTTITVYSWAFATVNDVWNWLYGDLHGSGGFTIFWGVLALALISATILAYFSDHNFYGGPSASGAAFGLMVCWYVDFGAWWAWAQIMTDIDGRDTSFGGLLLTNFTVLIAVIVVIMFVYSFGDLATMAKSRESKNQHVQKVGAAK